MTQLRKISCEINARKTEMQKLKNIKDLKQESGERDRKMKNFKNISREIEKAIINKENDKRFNDKKLFLYSDRKKRTCTEEGTTK